MHFRLCEQPGQVLNRGFALMAALLLVLSLSESPAWADSSDSDAIIDLGLAERVGPLKGPRKTLSVGQVDSIGAYTAFYGSWDVGGGVAAMMVTAMRETEHFIVLERASIDQILSEQELAASGLTRGGSGGQLGQLFNSQLLVIASITEYGTADEGAAIDIGIIGGPVRKKSSSSASRKKDKGRVSMDVRLIETATTQVIKAFSVSEEIKDSSHSISIGYDMMNFGGNTFSKTPLGEATRRLVAQAAERLVAEARSVPWTGQVVEADEKVVIVNGGTKAGIKVGDTFVIQHQTKAFIDPDSSEQLGVEMRSVGTVTISVVEAKMSWGDYASTGGYANRGDTIVLLSR